MKKYSNCIRGVKGRIAKKYMREQLKQEHGVLYQLTIKVGDYVNDCDGFNYKVTSLKQIWLPCSDYFYQNGKSGTFLREVIVYYGDGFRTCHTQPPLSPEEIQTYQKSFYLLTEESVLEKRKEGWWTEKSDECRDFLASGQLCCDENGSPVSIFAVSQKLKGDV
jgi:hypothetical protein